jgi:hypothetical protein
MYRNGTHDSYAFVRLFFLVHVVLFFR